MDGPTAAAGRSGGGLPIDQWIALNDEIAALVRSGLPLERGLASVGGDFGGKLGSVARSLGERMEGGESLPEALDSLGSTVPPIYRAVVEAGARSGRLASALEGLADHARRYVEMRRALGLALFYPLIVFVLTYALLIAFLLFLAPVLAGVMADLRLPSNPAATVLAALGRSARWWWPVGPVFLVFVLFSWWRMGRASGFWGWGHRLLRHLPWIGELLRLSVWAEFAGLLALLVEHEVPLPTALQLAGRASGDHRIAGATAAMAAEVAQGRSEGWVARGTGLPSLVVWILSNGQRGRALGASLRQAADGYHRRAGIQAELVRTLLPISAMVVLGALTVFVYGLSLFVPLSLLMEQLGRVAR